ncbi:MAG: aminopeptidase P family protein [Oscillospiraceae bacterium]|nr:aminopeptidase P family protein [Oscillospiraceae bacterium]
MIRERINRLRRCMAQRGIDAYLIPTSDFHESEYVGEYFKAREYMSGFTGSAGTMVVTPAEACLWTDGRYFIQAAAQLAPGGVILQKMGEEGYPTLEEYLERTLPEGGVLGFDGRVICAKTALSLQKRLAARKVSFATSEDLVGEIWEDRPALSCEPAFDLDIRYCGETAFSKLTRLRDKMAAAGADFHIVTALDDIAWLLNIRGNDVACNPMLLSYLTVSAAKAVLYCAGKAIGAGLAGRLAADGVELRPYEQIYRDAAGVPAGSSVMLDPAKVNYEIFRLLGTNVKKIEQENPSTFFKAIKNPVEIENLRRSHLKDGVAFTKFMFWLKTRVGKQPMTELDAAEYLENCRRAQEGYIEPSFDMIAAYGPNAAMMHYSATKESNAEIHPKGMLLVDSGGQYYEGTTDITRTMVLGPISDEVRRHFTAVVRGNLNLARAKFLYGCRGINLDYLARGPVWELDLDYKCGTGHGVGFLLGVHEAPNGFRWKIVPERNDSCVLEEGMFTTDEPGIYIEGSHGIRIENELICRKGVKNEYGQFMEFENITCAPIDLDGIDPMQMSAPEKEYLNRYHAAVFEKLSPFLTGEETEWLRRYTRAI